MKAQTLPARPADVCLRILDLLQDAVGIPHVQRTIPQLLAQTKQLAARQGRSMSAETELAASRILAEQGINNRRCIMLALPARQSAQLHFAVICSYSSACSVAQHFPNVALHAQSWQSRHLLSTACIL